MSIRARYFHAPLFLCDADGCRKSRGSNADLPRGWVVGAFNDFHLCTAHRHLKDRYDQIARTDGVWALTGRKGPG